MLTVSKTTSWQSRNSWQFQKRSLSSCNDLKSQFSTQSILDCFKNDISTVEKVTMSVALRLSRPPGIKETNFRVYQTYLLGLVALGWSPLLLCILALNRMCFSVTFFCFAFVMPNYLLFNKKSYFFAKDEYFWWKKI